MADATGDSAIVEIQVGTVVIFHGHEYRILTNPPSYQAEFENAAKFKDVKQDNPVDRFKICLAGRANVNVSCAHS